MSGGARAEIQIVLKNDFIETYKDKATIDAHLVVDIAHKHPNPGAKDGDMHVAGRADEVGLALVAEVMNAAQEKQAVNRVHQAQGTGQAVPVTGAWRIWCEHGGSDVQTQGDPLEPFTTTNPAHVFEIHPLTDFDGIQLGGSFHSIRGFVPKNAHDAFQTYENLRSEIQPSADGSTTTIIAGMAGYNYVEFAVILNEDPVELDDGHAAISDVYSTDGELLVRRRRMVFVSGTQPDDKAGSVHAGDRLHVLGIPRVDLKLVSWRAKHAQERPEALKWSLPYEMVVVAVYPN
jgi:hypothetical protein